MKSSKFFLRLVQFLTTAVIVGTLGMILVLSGVISWDTFKLDGTGTGNGNGPGKIQRPKETVNRSVQELINAGDRAVFSGNLDAAKSFYQQASQNAPREALPYEKIGDLNLREADYEAALQNFRLAYSLSAQNTYIIKSTRSLLGLRKITDANDELNKITPETPESLYYKGVIAAALNNEGAAQEYLNKSRSGTTDEKIIKKVETIMAVYRLYGVAEEAPAEYLQTLLAQAMDQNQEYGLAIALAFDALKSEHNYRDAWITLGHAFLNEKKWMDADDALTKAIDLDSSNAVSFFFRGIAKRNQDKPTEALADFEAASTLGYRPEIYIKQQMADTYYDLKNLEKAFPLYKDVAMSDPSDINVFIRPMALAIHHINKPQEAIVLARKAAETHPNVAMAENLLGWAALANNDLSGARDHLKEALKKDPDLAAAYLNLGSLYELEKNKVEALRNYDKAATLSQAIGDSSIADTARVRYNYLNTLPDTPTDGSGTTPQPVAPTTTSTKIVPSLSLQ